MLSFEKVIGQDSITHTLKNSLKTNQLPQALLFSGPRGVGKTSCARILAKKINNLESKNSEEFSFNIFELDAASNNSVEDIRKINEQVRIPPQIGKYKVYIIDEAHMLSNSAFNAFLKTLEEPPKHIIFILATTEKNKIIPTILSRCQIYDFKRISVIEIQSYLKKIAIESKCKFEENALFLIAQKADGSLRDALSIYDRMVSFTKADLNEKSVADNLNLLDNETYCRLGKIIFNNNIAELIKSYDLLIKRGIENIQFINGKKEAKIISNSNVFEGIDSKKTILYIDVGGGSTELSIIRNKRVLKSISLKIGTVRLLEDGVDSKTWNKAKEWVITCTKPYKNIFLLGTGGNINKLHKISKNKENQPLSYNELKKIYTNLNSLSYEERIIEFALNQDRSDVIIPATELFLKIFEWSGAKLVYVPRVGLSDGMIKELYKSTKLITNRE